MRCSGSSAGSSAGYEPTAPASVPQLRPAAVRRQLSGLWLAAPARADQPDDGLGRAPAPRRDRPRSPRGLRRLVPGLDASWPPRRRPHCRPRRPGRSRRRPRGSAQSSMQVMQQPERGQTMTCQVDVCEREIGRNGARGMCKLHYDRWRKHGDPLAHQPPRQASTAITCAIDGCQKGRYQRSLLCSTHHMRRHRYGDPLISKDKSGLGWTGSHGYRFRTMHDHPLANERGHVYEHRVVLYDDLGSGPQACYWCGTTVEWGSTLRVDHLDGDKANNTPANLVPSCHRCNCARGRWWPELQPHAEASA